MIIPRAKRWLVLLSAVVILSLFVPVTGVSAADPVVNFPDINLETAIRNAIKKPSGDIHQSELQGVYELTADNSNISNLTGLEYCTQLMDIEVNNNQISSLSPLTSLPKLYMLDLQYNKISNISPLANLMTVKYLYLNDNQISDISPLAGLTNLSSLTLADNMISNISPLAHLTNLTWLTLGNNTVIDISALAAMTKITSLSLGSNRISNISALAALTETATLFADHNSISDISALSHLTKLTTLYLGFNQISDISALAANSGLSNKTTIDLFEDPLNAVSVNTYIPQLESRGVNVDYYISPSLTTATTTTTTPLHTYPANTTVSPLQWLLIGLGCLFAVYVIYSIVQTQYRSRTRIKKFEITDAAELTAAANYRAFYNRIKVLGTVPSGLGIFTIIAGIVLTVVSGQLVIVPIIVGLLLLAVGKLIAVKPGRQSALLCIIALLAFGAWILFNGISNIVPVVVSIVNGSFSDLSGYVMPATVVSIIWIPFWFILIKNEVVKARGTYRDSASGPGPKPSDEALKRMDALYKTIVFADYKKEPDSIRFMTFHPGEQKTPKIYRGKLSGSYGMLMEIMGGYYYAQIVRPEDLEIMESTVGSRAQQVPNFQLGVTLVINKTTYQCRIDKLSLARLQAWKNSTPLT